MASSRAQGAAGELRPGRDFERAGLGNAAFRPQPRYRSESRRISRRGGPLKSMAHEGNRSGGLHVGDLVKIFCRSAEAWFDGEITQLLDGGFLYVEFEVDDENWCSKKVHITSENLREIPRSTKMQQDSSLAQRYDQAQTITFLSKVELFQRLPRDQLPVLATACVKKEFSKGTRIIQQAEYGNEFYVIVDGTVSVYIDGKQVKIFTVGDHFGEMALLRDEPRTATVIAEEDVQTLMITRAKFQEMALIERLDFPMRQAVGGGGDRKVETKPPTKKTADDRRLIAQTLKNNSKLAELVMLDDAKIQELCDLAWEQRVPAGHTLIEQGTDGDYFYMVKEGSFEITVDHAEGGQHAEQSHVEHVGVVSTGGSFGELALLYFAPRAASVIAKCAGTVWVIDRDNFKRILAKSADDFAKERVKYLDKTNVFKDLKADERYEVAKTLAECSFAAGEYLFEQGEKGTDFYILYDGEVAVIKDNIEVARLKGTAESVEIFGELALLTSERRQATIKALSDIKALSMDKTSFDLLLGPLSEIQRRGKHGGTSQVGKGRATQLSKEAVEKQKQKRWNNRIIRKDLTPLGFLGCGGFGAVEMVEHNETQDTYALKAVSKGYIVKCGMKKSVMHEKNIQLMCDSDFVVRLYETYNGDHFLYFLLELALGGELYATYRKRGFYGSVKHAHFYVAGAVYAFEHLHAKKIIFRDLKPENMLLTENGDIKLTDLGLAKVVAGKTFTTCGTPDYFAPEVIASTGHTHAVDWWTLGVLVFELMTGHTPFESAAPVEIYSKVKKGISQVSFPPKCRGHCEDLVRGLCKRDPSERIPMKKGGIANIMDHAWYKGFDWESMKEHALDPPYVPQVKSRTDMANFSSKKGRMPPQIDYRDDGTGWDKDFATSF